MKVYLSSTLNDLGPERQAVKDALGGECTVVESYIADERSVRESCLADVASCDVYIGIISRRYGFIPPGETLSITHLEYEKARECEVPRLVFLKDDDSIKGLFWDAVTGENPSERIESFRQRVGGGAEGATRPMLFKTPEDLKSHVLKAYFRLASRLAEPKPKRMAGRPYPGLRAFRTDEADRFFGRDAEVEMLVERVLARGERFLAVIGASGSGKSSLVYAGLIALLTAAPIVAGVRWRPIAFSPRELGDDPFQPLAAALTKVFPDPGWRVPDLTARLRTQPGDIAAVAREALGDDGPGAQLLLFVDQFEEIFAGKVDSTTRAAFFQLLEAAAACPLLRVVIAMRSDFYGQWPQDEAMIALLRAGHFPVGIPGQVALKEMIVGPAKAAGLTIAPQLVQRILDETGTAPGALALAEYALSQLYDRRKGNSLTREAYKAIGGVAGAINGLAEEALRGAGAEVDEDALSRLFLAIASVEERGEAEGAELTVVRRRAAKRDLPEAALALAQTLADKRLLMMSGGAGDPAAVIEVAHEAVFSHWERFQSWYARYYRDLALRDQARRAADDWEKGQRRTVLRWGWERQKPALEALRKLSHLAPPGLDADFADPDIVSWCLLEAQLEPRLRRFLYPEPLALLDELNSDDTPHQRREEIGLRLNQLCDPRRGVGLDEAGLPDIAWIDVLPGEVTLETEARDTFDVQRFRIARFPVTWAQYRAFLDAEDGYCEPSWWEGLRREEKPGALRWAFGNYPVVNVSWYDALAYCRWLGAKLGLDIRLPTELQWQWAAVGDTKREYPWSGDWNSARANSSEAGIGRTVAVGLYPLGRGPFGIDDMAGNVWEWCLNELGNPRSTALRMTVSRVLRGGAWFSDPGYCRAAFHDGYVPGARNYSYGFRVLCSSHIE